MSKQLGFKLKADGTVYLTREGKEVTLTPYTGNWHKFFGSNEYYYGENGGLYSDGGTCQRDIVSVKVTSHPHAELMLEYANDAKTTDKPWLLWETYYHSQWDDLCSNPIWSIQCQYRRKPKQKPMIKIGEFTVPQSLRVKPNSGADYYVLTISYIVGYTWEDDPADNEYFSDGRCYETKADAEQVRQAILSLLKK